MISPKRAKLSPDHRVEYVDDEEDEEDILLGSDPVAEILEWRNKNFAILNNLKRSYWNIWKFILYYTQQKRFYLIVRLK